MMEQAQDSVSSETLVREIVGILDVPSGHEIIRRCENHLLTWIEGLSILVDTIESVTDFRF